MWLAEHRASGQLVAVKVLSKARASDARHLRAFRREARAIAALDHPHIVTVHDYGAIPAAAAEASRERLTGDSPYLVMEYVRGGNLNAWRGKLTWPQLRAILLSLLDALAHAHARRVLHRDIKPGNVLVGAEAHEVRLTDFGLAHAVDREGLTLTSPAGGMGGTPAYMAPEQFVGDPRDVGPWSDLYALGCMVYSLVSGSPPFGRKPWLEVANGHLRRAPPALETQLQLPRGFRGWLAKLLEKDAVKRYQRAADAAWDLSELDDPTELVRPIQIDDLDSEGPFAHAHVTQTTLQWGSQFARTSASDGFGLGPLHNGAPPMPVNWQGAARPFKPALGTGLFEIQHLPIVGRLSERSELWDALRQVRESGRPRTVVLRGSAGVGKTRMGSWLAMRSEELGAATALWGQHQAEGGRSHGLGPLVARWARSVGIDSTEEVERRVQVSLEFSGIGDDALARALTRVVLPELDQSGNVNGVDSGSERIAAVSRLVQGLSSNRPVVVWLDDIQWGAEAVQWVQQAQNLNCPILLVCACRDETLQADSGLLAGIRGLCEDEGRELQLQPLGLDDRNALLGGILGLSPQLSARVGERVGGNPDFALQLVKSWLRNDLLVRRSTGWALKAGVQLTIPDDLHGAWAKAFTDLVEGRGERDVDALHLAAILGRHVDLEQWRNAAALAGCGPSDGLLESILRSQLAYLDESGWRFVHSIAHESVLRMARESGRWAQLHAHAAKVCANPARPTERIGLARHLREAGSLDASRLQMRRAIQEAIESGELATCDAAMDEYQALCDAAAVEHASTEQAWPALFRAELAAMAGQDSTARVFARRAVDMARHVNNTVALRRAVMVQGRLELRRGDLERARDLFEQATQLARKEGDALAVASAEQHLAVTLCRLQAFPESRALFDRSMTTFQRFARKDLEGSGWLGLAALARAGDQFDQARQWSDRAVMCFISAGHVRGLVRAKNSVGDHQRLTGDLPGATRTLRALLDEHGRLRLGAVHLARLNLAQVYLAQERWQEARAEFQKFEASGEQYAIAQSVMNGGLSACAAHRRDYEELRRRLFLIAHLQEGRHVVHPDLALVLQLAGSEAATNGLHDLARLGLELALAQWKQLNRQRRVAALQRALDALD